jgi:DNA-binding response OmpR family regulator
MKVLIIDDDTELLDTLGYVFRREGYEVFSAADGQQGLKQCQALAPDIVVLDGILPKVDGFEVCRQIRQRGSTPIIILSARTAEDDRIRALQLGADDYITKPFGTRELCARMKALLRRSRPAVDHELAGEVRAGDLVLHLQSHQLTKRDTPVRVTRIEFRILSLLAFHAGEIVPHRRLIQYAWGYQDEGNASLLKTHICHIRKKLDLHWNGQRGIESMVNVGYRLVPSSAAPRVLSRAS